MKYTSDEIRLLGSCMPHDTLDDIDRKIKRLKEMQNEAFSTTNMDVLLMVSIVSALSECYNNRINYLIQKFEIVINLDKK